MKITDALMNTGAGVVGGVASALVKKLPVNDKISDGIALAASAAIPLFFPNQVTYALGAGMAGVAGKDLIVSLTGTSFISGANNDDYLPYYDTDNSISGEEVAVANDNAISGAVSGLDSVAVANDNAISGLSGVNPDSVGML